MRSSTSSFDVRGPFTRAPEANWFRIAGWTLAVAVALLTTAEIVLRRNGFAPTVEDSPTLWAQQRARLENAPVAADALVFLGRSRMMQAIDRQVLAETFPARGFVQLAIAGEQRHPLAVLQDIADNTAFGGVLVIGVTEDSFEARHWAGQADLVDYYHQRFRLNDSLNEWLSVVAQEHFAFLRPEVAIRSLAITVIRRGSAPSPGVEMDRYRFRNTQFRETAFSRQRLRETRRRLRLEIDDVMNGRAEQPDRQAWLRDALAADEWVERIQRRGGRVVYLRMPTGGEFWTLGDLLYPRATFWDVLASHTAATTVHFADYASLANFELPDLSHIRGEDRRRFTEALIDTLSRKGVL